MRARTCFCAAGTGYDHRSTRDARGIACVKKKKRKKIKKKRINSDLRKSKKKLNDVCTNTTNENFVTFYGHNPSKDKVEKKIWKKKKKKIEQEITKYNLV